MHPGGARASLPLYGGGVDPEDLESIRFECTRCGACCRRPGWVFLREGEAERIASFLGKALEDLPSAHLARVEGEWAIRVPDERGCPFLRGDLCGIQEVKPDQCRSYPFWLELLLDGKRWKEEAAFCEGIGRGEPLSFEEVRRLALLDPGTPD